MAERKKFYAEAGSRLDTGKFLIKLEGVSYILTNDIVSSAFFNATSARLPIFTINFNGRCPTFAKDMGVKYDKFMILDPLIYESLALI